MAGLRDLTKEQSQIAERNGIQRKTLGSRLTKGWSIDKAITIRTNESYSRKRKGHMLQGHYISDEQMAVATSNGIQIKTLSARLKHGWSIEDSITKDTRRIRYGGNPKSEIDGDELLEIIGRIKYLRMQEKDFPMPIPKPLLIKLKRIGRTLDDVQALKC